MNIGGQDGQYQENTKPLMQEPMHMIIKKYVSDNGNYCVKKEILDGIVNSNPSYALEYVRRMINDLITAGELIPYNGDSGNKYFELRDDIRQALAPNQQSAVNVNENLKKK
jgi:hypothetical protein